MCLEHKNVYFIKKLTKVLKRCFMEYVSQWISTMLKLSHFNGLKNDTN